MTITQPRAVSMTISDAQQRWTEIPATLRGAVLNWLCVKHGSLFIIEVNAKSSCLNKSNNLTNFLLSYSQNCTIKCACLTSHDEGASSAQSRTEPTGLCVSVCAFCLWSVRSGVDVTACLYVQCRCSVDRSWVCRSG